MIDALKRIAAWFMIRGAHAPPTIVFAYETERDAREAQDAFDISAREEWGAMFVTAPGTPGERRLHGTAIYFIGKDRPSTPARHYKCAHCLDGLKVPADQTKDYRCPKCGADTLPF